MSAAPTRRRGLVWSWAERRWFRVTRAGLVAIAAAAASCTGARGPAPDAGNCTVIVVAGVDAGPTPNPGY